MVIDPTMVGLHHVQLAIAAGSEDVCRGFWRDILGMTELAKPPGLARRGGCRFYAADPLGNRLEFLEPEQG